MDWGRDSKLFFFADQLLFVTKWDISSKNDDESIRCKQEVKTEGADEAVNNHFLVGDFTPSAFTIELTNDIVGHAAGTGIIDEKTIAWEFRDQAAFQGYEVFRLLEDGEYSFHAEYTSPPDQFRTIIEGRLRPVN